MEDNQAVTSGQRSSRIGGRPWKKNLLRVPENISVKVQKAKKPDLVVACTRKLTLDQVKAGIFAHLGIEWTGGRLSYPKAPVVPPEASGRYSTRNLNGRAIVREDLPMVTQTITFETPNYGDWSKGSHETNWDRDVYQREYEAPRNLDISVELLTEESESGERLFVVKFQVDAVLRRGSRGFQDELLYALNLLQENVGAVDVFPADATREEYLKTIYVAWEILPPGERDATIARVLSRIRKPSDEVKALILARYNLLSSLRPIAFVSGTSGFQRYFGAQFADNLVVFENLEYGNAIYVMFEEWRTLSKQTRLELLKGDTTKFRRIVHSRGWEAQLKGVVREKRPKVRG